MKPSDIKLALPWSNVADKDLPSFDPHPDLEGQLLNWYRLKCGTYVRIPQPFPRFDEEDQK